MYNKFVAEGPKLVIDLLKNGSFALDSIYITVNCAEFELITSLCNPATIHGISNSELERISLQQSPQGVFAIFDKRYEDISNTDLSKGYHLLLDGIQDPGNAGTIIRIADWFGIKSVVRTNDTVDFFNPKVVQASMGSLGAIKLINLAEGMSELLKNTNLIGLDLKGERIDEFVFPENAIFVIGREGRGLSEEISKLINHRVFIPGSDSRRAESLNASVATGILASRLI